jgi:hypothetical protein
MLVDRYARTGARTRNAGMNWHSHRHTYCFALSNCKVSAGARGGKKSGVPLYGVPLVGARLDYTKWIKKWMGGRSGEEGKREEGERGPERK